MLEARNVLGMLQQFGRILERWKTAKSKIDKSVESSLFPLILVYFV